MPRYCTVLVDYQASKEDVVCAELSHCKLSPSLGMLQFVGKLCDLPCRPLKAPVLLGSLAKALFHGASMLLHNDALC